MLKKVFFILFSLILMMLIYNWGWLNNPAQFILRYQNTGLNSHFSISPATTFSDYIQITEKMIRAARLKNKVAASDEVIAENSPRILLPDASCPSTNGKYAKGILLIHGMLDSPYPMSWLGTYFQKKCFVVYIILLPGHGTSPGDLHQVRYQDWLAVSQYGIDKLKEQVSSVYVAGFSLGGLLAIQTALKNPDIKALILFAPPINFATKLQSVIKPVYWLGRLIPRLRWWAYENDDVYVRYNSFPVNPVYQTLLLLEKTKSDLAMHALPIPVFMEQSAQDTTVDAKSTLEFFSQNKNPASRLLWYSQFKNDLNTEDSRIKIIDSAIPQEKILSLSHLSLFLPDTDKIYGRNGSYRDCLHYQTNSTQWLECKNGKNNFLGEITDANLKAHLMQRITFNPLNSLFIMQLDLFLQAN